MDASEAVQEEPMTTTTAAATKPRPTKTTAKATDTSPSAHPMAPEPMAPKPMARRHGEAMLAELRKPLYAYIGAGDLALEKLREIPTEWPKISAALSDEATKSQEAMSAEMARLHEQLSVEKLQATLTVEQLRKLPEQANELRSQLQDHAMALGDRAGDLYQDLVARGERVVESRR
jgi:hypothetical protein